MATASTAASATEDDDDGGGHGGDTAPTEAAATAPAPHDFCFLSGTQVLQLDRLTSRQALEVEQQHKTRRRQGPAAAVVVRRRNLHRDPALLYVFVSHRWEEPANPDASGRQLRALKSILRLVESMLLRRRRPGRRRQPSKRKDDDVDGDDRGADGDEEDGVTTSSWPTDVTQLAEGVPQAASLVARIQAKIAKKSSNEDGELEKFRAMMESPLDHVYLWYDCACLPQKFPSPRTPAETAEFKDALQHLDWLVRQCELLCLRIPRDEYEHRAWCAFEHFVKQTVDFEGDVAVDCLGLEQEHKFDWHLKDEEDDDEAGDKAAAAPPALRPGLENLRLALLKRQQAQERQSVMDREARRVMRETQQTQLKVAQGKWDRAVLDRRGGGADAIPDLARDQYRIRHATARAEPSPPLQSAMKQLTRELFQVLYCMSCRDAAALRPSTGHAVVAADHNACLADCGIQCGLHQGNTPERAARLLRLIETEEVTDGLQFVPGDVGETGISADVLLRMHCNGKKGRKHRLIPNVACTKRWCDNQASCPLKDRDIPAGSVYVGCLPCDYDLCYACAMSRIKGSPAVKGDGTAKAPSNEYEAAGVPKPSDFQRMSAEEKLDVSMKAKKKESKQVAKVDEGTSQAALDAVLEAYGSVYPEDNASTAKTEPVMVERKISLDLYELSSKMLARFGLKCTNDGDAAFVGLLALRNFLQGGNKTSDKTGLRLSVGLVTHMLGVVEAAVDHFAVRLAEGVPLHSLVATVTIRAPRWVFLDLANSRSPVSANLFSIVNLSGVKAQEYLSKNPDCVTHSLEPSEVPLPVPVQFCQLNDECNCIWSQCTHQMLEMVMARSFLAQAHSTLDSWATTRLPFKLCQFGCAVIWSEIFLIGGSCNWNEEMKLYEGCLGKTYVGTLDSQGGKWKDIGFDLNTPRFSHQCCAIEDDKGQLALIAISGGRDEQDKKLSSMEFLSLDPNDHGAGWVQGPTMPVARSAHHMCHVGNCLFLFGGTMDDDDHDRLTECHIYNLSSKSWSLGPTLREPCRGGDAVVVFNRFIILVGGISPANKPIQKAWVLDAKPWIEWCGSEGQKRKPNKAWVPGPAFPHPVMTANLTIIPLTDTKDGTEWILSVSSLASGNVVYGLHLFQLPTGDFPLTLWQGLKWVQLGSTPDIVSFGKCVVVDRMLAIIGGDRFPTNKASDMVHYRRLLLDEDEGESKASAMQKIKKAPPIRGANPVEQKGSFFHLEANYLALNDAYLTGRLGFPLKEEALFSQNGTTKKLITLRPALESKKQSPVAPLHCQRCLIRTRSLDAARANLRACHFGIRVQSPGIRIPLCSSCLCALYHDDSAMKKAIEPPEGARGLSAGVQEEGSETGSALAMTQGVTAKKLNAAVRQTAMGQAPETDPSVTLQGRDSTSGRDRTVMGKEPATDVPASQQIQSDGVGRVPTATVGHEPETDARANA